MGIYVRLAILPHNISPEEWSKTYAEVLFFLEECPYDLMGLKKERIWGKDRVVFTRQIERNKDDPKECHLYIIGDFQSRETAESFILFKNLNAYREKSSTDHLNDILVTLLEDRKGISHIFEDKTQGYPYHIPMLAAAMIIEDRFPEAAYVSGDINFAQAEKAQLMLKNVLRRDVDLPVCVDAHKLFKRLQKYYQGGVLIDNFAKLFRGSSIDAMEAMYQLFEPNEFIQWFVSQIKQFHSPKQLGVIGYFVDWLSVTKDLHTLCHLACLNKNGPQFNHLEFALGLASTWISVKGDAQEKEEGSVDTVESQLSSVLLDMGGFKGRKMHFHIDEESVINILKQNFPADAQEMEKAFLKETRDIQANLVKMTDLAVKRESAKYQERDPENGNGMSFLCMDFTSIEQLSPEQRKMLNWIATSIRRIRKEMLEEDPMLLERPEKELKKTIFDQSAHVGVVLAEEAWDWIEHEEDLELLKIIVILLYINSQGLTFCNLRDAILENRKLCKAVLELSKN